MTEIKDSTKQPEAVNITIVYDNNPMLKGLETDWGFSCLVEVGKLKILFDTGNNGNIFLSNMNKLGINPQSIDICFLSHLHYDHTGGLKEFLEKNSNLKIYYPQSFPRELIEVIENSGAVPVPVSGFTEILPDVYSLGELNGSIPEQSLAVRSPEGIVIITGCAHPGIINILQKAKTKFPGETIYLALGGFHLRSFDENGLNEVIKKITEMDIRKLAPTHCSGDLTRKMFKEFFGSNYIEAGAGKVINIK
ncbi:MAG: MBL fold metallo-hydrolase [Ignavibacteria bacterium]